jgi:hypothetical protein
MPIQSRPYSAFLWPDWPGRGLLLAYKQTR